MSNKKNKRKTGKLSLPEAYSVAVKSEETSAVDVEKNALESLMSKAKGSTTQELKKASKSLAEDNAVKKALAEISFIEAGETLEKGDIQSSIAKYKEAISYVDNLSYYLKLADTLKKDSKYKTELDALLKDLTKKFPNNDDVKSKINELAPPKQELKNSVKINTNASKVTAVITKSLENNKEKEVNAQPTKQLKSHVKFDRKSDKKPDTKSDTKPDIAPKAAKMVRLRNNVYVLTEGVKKQNPYVKAITILFLILMPIGIFWGLNQSYKETVIETLPLSPDSQSKLVENELYFCWTSSTDKVDYLFQIEQEGKPILERYTREKFYLISQEDAKLIKKNLYSTWRVIPLSPKRDSLKYKAQEGQFMLVEEPKATQG